MLEEGGQESSGSAVQEWSIEEEREGVDKWVKSNISKINVEGVLRPSLVTNEAPTCFPGQSYRIPGCWWGRHQAIDWQIRIEISDY